MILSIQFWGLIRPNRPVHLQVSLLKKAEGQWGNKRNLLISGTEWMHLWFWFLVSGCILIISYLWEAGMPRVPDASIVPLIDRDTLSALHWASIYQNTHCALHRLGGVHVLHGEGSQEYGAYTFWLAMRHDTAPPLSVCRLQALCRLLTIVGYNGANCWIIGWGDYLLIYRTLQLFRKWLTRKVIPGKPLLKSVNEFLQIVMA